MTSSFVPTPSPYDKIEALLEAYEEAIGEYAAVLSNAALNEATYKVEYAKAYRVVAGNPDLKTVDAKNSEATIMTAELLEKRLTSAAIAEAHKQRCRALGEQLSGYQTLANASRGV